MPITTVLFDLDNTLYPSSSGIMGMFDKRITEYVQNFLHLDAETAAALRHEYYSNYGTTLRGLQANHTVDVEDYMTYVHELEISSFLTLDAELDRLLGEVRAAKAIFTNSPAEHAARVLAALGIERHFDRIFDIRFNGFEPKPAPASYQRVLDALGITGPEVVFVEDIAKNLEPARALGMTTILLGEQLSEQPASLADYIVPDTIAAVRTVLELERAR